MFRVVNRPEQPERVLTLLQRTSPPRPTPSFRARAWREFQRALDPLAAPKPLTACARLIRSSVASGRGARCSRRGRVRPSSPSPRPGSAGTPRAASARAARRARGAPASIVSVVNGSTAGERRSASAEDAAVEERRVRLDVAEEEAGELGILARASRSSPARAAPSRARVARPSRSPARAGTRPAGSAYSSGESARR